MRKVIILAGVICCSSSAIFARFADAPSPVLVFYRMLFSALILSVTTPATHRSSSEKVSGRDLLFCVLSGLFFGLHLASFFFSVQMTSIASSVVLSNMEVFFVALGGRIFLKERLSRVGMAGLCITFLGSVILAGGDMAGGHLAGDIIALTAGLLSSFYTLIGRKVRSRISTSTYTLIVYSTAAMVALIFSFLTRSTIYPVSLVTLGSALGMTIFCTLMGHSVFSWGLKYEKAAFISTVKLMEPVSAAIMAYLLFQEMPGTTAFMGGALVIAGIVTCIRSESK